MHGAGLRGFAAYLIAGGVLVPRSAEAATLPEHDPIFIVVVGDQVNPHGLSDAELTQPADLAAALQRPDSGLSLAGLDEVDSACVDEALDALNAGVDVFVYFAHRAARRCDGSDAQMDLTAAVQTHLRSHGGVVVFHHGIYTAAGKEPILELLGSSANSIDWQPTTGQAVVAVGGDHFVATQGLTFPQTRSVANDALGVPSADYPAFVNVPDERYPTLSLRASAGESRTPLFVSDYASPAPILGYDLWRSDWTGHVIAYQPGEYQPQALDDASGPNFQILVNAVYFAATTHEIPDGGETTGDGTTSDSGGGSTTSSGTTTTTTTATTTTATSAAGSGGASDTEPTATQPEGDAGCGCRADRARPTDRPPLPALALLAIGCGGLVRRRARGAPVDRDRAQ